MSVALACCIVATTVRDRLLRLVRRLPFRGWGDGPVYQNRLGRVNEKITRFGRFELCFLTLETAARPHREMSAEQLLVGNRRDPKR